MKQSHTDELLFLFKQANTYQTQKRCKIYEDLECLDQTQTVNTQKTTLCSKTLRQTHTLRWSWLTLRLGGSYTLFPLCALVNSMTVCLIKAARCRVQVLRTQQGSWLSQGPLCVYSDCFKVREREQRNMKRAQASLVPLPTASRMHCPEAMPMVISLVSCNDFFLSKKQVHLK